ncbi:GAF domain-containing protein [Marixanthomonas spongiae]|uniref:GAF domain-containing protein n=1 Tax=Marixanthomonas spongiae TaxID=2174845 RepID=A0A2U0I491_9FLAO|nr:GAF domain-containing protein [Marixanthomonas spongiae]PVW15908.1 GAF domain-containing protein [Marixanthomonas spongiae]
MKAKNNDFPFQVQISFAKLFEKYRQQLNASNSVEKERAQAVMAIAEAYPKLSTGFDDKKELEAYAPQIDVILSDLFSPILQENEIRAATIPFQNLVFKSTKRYKHILSEAVTDYEPHFNNLDEDHMYIMACCIILSVHYGYQVDFKTPWHYKIPDKHGIEHNYRVMYNGDFVDFIKTDKAKEITKNDFEELIDGFTNIALWKEKFPPGSWVFKGFVIANLFDVTLDVSISNFKSNLLRNNLEKDNISESFESIFKSIFQLKELQIGFSEFNEEDQLFEKFIFKDVDSYILNQKDREHCQTALCEASYYKLFKQKEFYCISNVPKYHKRYPDNKLYKKLLNQGIKSAILASIINKEGKVLGVLELVSPNINHLNSINANKLKTIMPFLVDSVIRSKKQIENKLELIIQEECTSLHPSVHWKFRNEAKRYLKSIAQGTPTYFKEVVFEDVFPLYGQIDIKSSSEVRNQATIKDLILQLEHIQEIIKQIHTLEPLPIYEHLQFRISNYLTELRDGLQVDSERQVLKFLHSEIIPLFKHLATKNESIKNLIEDYDQRIDQNSGLIYKHRKDYDDAVMIINKRMASIIDKKQVEAQAMYPHYFERFKTDGVEHNLYIGEAITKNNSFDKIYLYNLRLWQLQVMCEMENSYYKIKDQLPVPLTVASMILAFNNSLSLRFRMDEKRFDVDGTYNARYEVVKKRVDKANIKGTEERVTQEGKIVIIYSQKEDEKEYLKYITFLQHKKQLDTDVEIVELEDLQGVTGLKAIRVSVLYSKQKDNKKEYYTYDDLISEIAN